MAVFLPIDWRVVPRPFPALLCQTPCLPMQLRGHAAGGGVGGAGGVARRGQGRRRQPPGPRPGAAAPAARLHPGHRLGVAAGAQAVACWHVQPVCMDTGAANSLLSHSFCSWLPTPPGSSRLFAHPLAEDHIQTLSPDLAQSCLRNHIVIAGAVGRNQDDGGGAAHRGGRRRRLQGRRPGTPPPPAVRAIPGSFLPSAVLSQLHVSEGPGASSIRALAAASATATACGAELLPCSLCTRPLFFSGPRQLDAVCVVSAGPPFYRTILFAFDLCLWLMCPIPPSGT